METQIDTSPEQRAVRYHEEMLAGLQRTVEAAWHCGEALEAVRHPRHAAPQGPVPGARHQDPGPGCVPQPRGTAAVAGSTVRSWGATAGRVAVGRVRRAPQLRPRAKAAMLAEARRDPAWSVLRSIPFLGPVRVAVLLATLQTPWRFRTKRNLWAYAGLAVVTYSSADYVIESGRPVRRRRAPMTRGLNRNYNRVVKDVFKSAATAATGRPGPLQTWYHHRVAGGMDEALARVTLTRKLAAITLRLWKTGERFDASHLTIPTS